MATIIVKLKDAIISEVDLDKDITLIGRDMKGDIYLKNPSVSRKHAHILKKGNLFYIEDLNSTNGTFVNGEMILWRKGLSDGDEIALGKYTLVFRDEYKEKTGRNVKLAPDFMDSTIKVPKKRSE